MKRSKKKSVLLGIPNHNIGFLHNNVSIGLSSLVSILRQNNIDTTFANFSNFSTKEVLDVIDNLKPTIVGLRCLTPERKYSLSLIKAIKKHDPSIIIVLGGPHATVMYEQLLRHYNEIDYLVIGEGEYSFSELTRAIFKQNTDFTNIRGIAFRKDEKIIKTDSRPAIKNLNSLPYPVFGFDISKSSNEIDQLYINTCRGCPQSCKYCTSNTIWGRTYRSLDSEYIVNMIEYYIDTYNIQRVHFCDDTFNSSKKRVIEICQKIIDRKLNIKWSSAARVDRIDEHTISLMRASGCVRLEFGVESGDPGLRKKMNKRITNEQIITTFKLCHNAGIEALAFIMWGYPGENISSISKTVSLLFKIKPHGISTSICGLLPGTELYDYYQSKNKISDKHWLNENNLIRPAQGYIRAALLILFNKLFCSIYKQRSTSKIAGYHWNKDKLFN